MKRTRRVSGGMKRTNKRSKRASNNAYTKNFSNMPIELLEEIIKKLPFSDYSRLRATSRLLRNVVDNILIRKLKNDIRMLESISSNYEYIYSKIYHQLAWPYIRYGFKSMVASVFLSLLNSPCYSCSSEEFPLFLHHYIMQFCHSIDCQMGDPDKKLSRLLYLITILGFLNKLTYVERMEKQINSKKLKLHFIMNGSNSGLTCTQTKWNTLNYPDDRNIFIIFLAEIMESNIIETPLRKKQVAFVKGKNKEDSVLVGFTIIGSKKLLEFLRTAPAAGDWEELPIDNFTVTINITCKGVHYSAGPKIYSFKI